MSIPRITPEIISEYGVVAEPDVLSGTPAQNKAVFDRLVRDKVAVSLNALLDEWDASSVCEAYRPEQNYHPLNKVIYEGATYECLQACTGVTPSEGPHWRRISAVSGDMDTADYDPQNRRADVFAYAETQTNNAKSALRAEMSTLLERGIYDTHSRKTDVFEYADAQDSTTKSALRAEMSTLLERGIYDTMNRKTDVFEYADAQDSTTKSALRAEMSTLLERGIYDTHSRKTDIFDYADAQANAVKVAAAAELAAAESRLAAQRGSLYLGTTAGTDRDLILPAADTPLTLGARILFRFHQTFLTLNSFLLKIGESEPLPLYFPYIGITPIPNGCFCEAMFTGTEYRVTFLSDHSRFYDKALTWITPLPMIGTWETLRAVCLNGITYLQGTAAQALSTAGPIAMLSTSTRPSVTLRIASAPGLSAEQSYIEVRPSGSIYHVYNGVPWKPVFCASFPAEA